MLVLFERIGQYLENVLELAEFLHVVLVWTAYMAGDRILLKVVVKPRLDVDWDGEHLD
jgi:hypothetical protein